MSLPQKLGLGAQYGGMPLSMPEDDCFSILSLIHSVTDLFSFTHVFMECSLSAKNFSRIKDTGTSDLLELTSYIAGETNYGKEANKYTIYFQAVISAITIIMKQGKRIQMYGVGF